MSPPTWPKKELNTEGTPTPQRYFKKRIRLPAEIYRQPGTCVFITFGTEARAPAFDDGLYAGSCVAFLRAQADRDSIAVLAFCFMPDHVHLLLRVDGSTSVVEFIRAFKSLSTRLWWKQSNAGRLWQRSFHDHVLRESESESEYIDYILSNPVRAGLAEDWVEYEFSGSFEYDMKTDA